MSFLKKRRQYILNDINGENALPFSYISERRVFGSLAGTIGRQNPLRYRGYIYDSETGFYYVSSRYYNPEVERFFSPIYRYGGTSHSNLTPREKDLYSGLSFSTIPRRGAAMTTIEILNATGIVYAVKDGSSHVSVRPVAGSMEEWIKTGYSSVWTQTIKKVVINEC